MACGLLAVLLAAWSTLELRSGLHSGGSRFALLGWLVVPYVAMLGLWLAARTTAARRAASIVVVALTAVGVGIVAWFQWAPAGPGADGLDSLLVLAVPPLQLAVLIVVGMPLVIGLNRVAG